MTNAIACMWPTWVPCCESDLPLVTWGSPAASHCEPVGILAQYMVIWLPMLPPASWIEVGAGGVQRKGCSSVLLFSNYEGSPYFPFHIVTLAPLPFHGPVTLPDLNSWQFLLSLSMVPLPCLTWIPGSLCNFLVGSPGSLKIFSPLCTSVSFLDHKKVYSVYEHGYVFLVY